MFITIFIGEPEYKVGDQVRIAAEPGWRGAWNAHNGETAQVTHVEGHFNYTVNDRGEITQYGGAWHYELRLEDGTVLDYSSHVNGVTVTLVSHATPV